MTVSIKHNFLFINNEVFVYTRNKSYNPSRNGPKRTILTAQNHAINENQYGLGVANNLNTKETTRNLSVLWIFRQKTSKLPGFWAPFGICKVKNAQN